ncbi:unnamed protein product [Orchesella dallaii]|uniref:Integrase catalytic domain-containing protein n=1 Tax=Orchesella dallaii TaxID=48710 RepID=A0ABP1Q6Q4_9HEXA
MLEDDIKQLHLRQRVSENSKLKKLVPFQDEEGLLRVEGRLHHADLPVDRRHPIILPRNNHLTSLIIEECHIRHFHSGASLTCAALQHDYWILGAKDAVRHQIRKCIRCKRVRATGMQQLMGNLPAGRVNQNRPFLHSGVDFAGPFQIKMRRGRGATSDKCYFAEFVCFTTKAVHIEVVTDLTTEAFIACLRRFTARRGVCSHLYSDCGTNFIGADRELSKQLLIVNRTSQQQCSELGITWAFNPPAAPHQGGLWEAAVKSIKFHLKRVMGTSLLTLEQFQTLLCNVEACLNSRPICALSSDATDYSALTPGHFLIGSQSRSQTSCKFNPTGFNIGVKLNK